MRCAASSAISRIVTRWPASGSPCGLVNRDLTSPTALARSFIRAANLGTEPAIPSATTTAALLAEATKRPCSRSQLHLRSRSERHRRASGEAPGLLGCGELNLQAQPPSPDLRRAGLNSGSASN